MDRIKSRDDECFDEKYYIIICKGTFNLCFASVIFLIQLGDFHESYEAIQLFSRKAECSYIVNILSTKLLSSLSSTSSIDWFFKQVCSFNYFVI